MTATPRKASLGDCGVRMPAWGNLKSYSPSHVTADVGQGDLAGAALETVFKFTL
ncbi:MAG: hypothetical protein WA624_07340 [Methylocella sp.]